MLNKVRFKILPERAALIAAVVCGFFVHLFGLLNIIHNYDDIFVHPVGFGSTIQSGRWGLAILGGVFHLLFGAYNVPFLYGVLFFVLAGFAASQMVAMFHVQNHKIAVLIGALFVVFPSATSTLFFKFTAHYYGVAILLAVTAAKLLAESKSGFVMGTLCMVFSLSIYQAYLPITIGLLVLILLKRALDDNEVTVAHTLRTGLFFCLSIITAVIVYRLMVDVTVVLGNKALVLVGQMMPDLVIDDFVLVDYQGISKMGQTTLPALLCSVVKSFEFFFAHPFNGFCGLAPTVLLKVLYPIFWVLTVTIPVVVLIVKKKRISHIVGVMLLLLLLPVAINFIVVMCPNSNIYTLMAYGFVLVPCAPLLLYESWHDTDAVLRLKKIVKRTLATASVVMVVAYTFSTTVNYTYMYYATRQTENYFASMVAQIRMTDDFTDDKPWAFIGNIHDSLLKNSWDVVPIYGGNANIKDMINNYSRNDWITHYVGYQPQWATNAQIAAIQASDEFKSMPVWPDAGSIRVIQDCVVVRFR